MEKLEPKKNTKEIPQTKMRNIAEGTNWNKNIKLK